MELIDGVSLESHLAARHSLTPDETIHIGLAVARALAAAHARGFLHRDIKPANVLLGRDGTIKVADFDLAGGTPGYMSPEAVAGRACDSRSDLFSLGVLLERTRDRRASVSSRQCSQDVRGDGALVLPRP